MIKNLASWDRIARVLGGCAMLAASIFAPFEPLVRLWAFGVPGLYVLATALAGTCLGYKLMGVSSCPLAQSSERSG